MVRIGLLSCAHPAAEAYAECLRRLPETKLAGIADDNPERGRAAAARHGTRYLSSEQLLSEEVDAVIVCAENARRPEGVRAAAAAGKPILCQQPLATNLPAARETIRFCREKGVTLATAFACRYLPAFARLKQSCEAGELGQILAARGTSRGMMPDGWLVDKELAGGGAVMEQAAPAVDLIRWLLGCEFVSVYAETGRLLHSENGIEDCASLILEMENGAIACLDPSWSRPRSYPFRRDLTVELVGTLGAALVDGFRQTIQLYRAQEEPPAWHYWGSDATELLLRDFAAAVHAGGPPPITGEAGLRALEVAVAAYRSAETGAPVRLADLR